MKGLLNDTSCLATLSCGLEGMVERNKCLQPPIPGQEMIRGQMEQDQPGLPSQVKTIGWGKNRVSRQCPVYRLGEVKIRQHNR